MATGRVRTQFGCNVGRGLSVTRASVRGVLRGEWTLILHFPGIRASLHASYDSPDNVRDKFLQIHGKPGLRDVLNQLAQYGAGQQMSYQTGRDLFTFTVTAENSLEAVDDWFDSD
ncbi:hypothetical protein Focb16_v012920 [Fusarium oxysporum f. sp. cubense]|uniref:Uncharacterized protein n=1 Tax=Fusarium oxysporum f. sp. cubense TaxID=61366 RepID=A0A559KPU2_FUSOC|nr:hypothetical protein Focb16_v012920 [Fusarium oxysporum f. sp. cubense]